MFKHLVKLFISDCENVSSQNVRGKYGMLSGIIGIILNVLLFVAKLIAGLVTFSISIMADAFNNLSDAGSSIVTLVGFRMAGKPADHEHPFGHGRIEYIAGFLVSMVILLVGVELVKSSIGKIMNPVLVSFSLLSFIILLSSIVVKLWMFFFNRFLSKRIQSEAIHSTALDSLSDAVATTTVVLGMGISYFTNWAVDGYFGIIVAIFILVTGFKSAKEMLDTLLGKPPAVEFVQEIEKTVLGHPEVLGVHDLIIHNYGPGRCMLSVHAEVSSEGNILMLHDCIDRIEMELRHKFHCDAVIHMDPLVVDDEVITRIHAEILCEAQEIDPCISLHDFRMVVGHTHTNLIFDLVVPYHFKLTDSEVIRLLRERIKEKNPMYNLVVKVDKPYV